jgi:twitching motility protein PilT
LIADLISKGEFLAVRDIVEKSSDSGMQTLDQALLDLVRRNLVTAPEARSRAAKKDAFPAS